MPDLYSRRSFLAGVLAAGTLSTTAGYLFTRRSPVTLTLVTGADPTGGRVVILEFSKPRNPVFGRLYRWYFRYVLPFVGQTISRSKDRAYEYLPASVLQFPDGEQMAERLRRHGLTNIVWRPLTFGIATLYVGEKP